jgi:formamidopyrimidine-DNA glycosylase
VETVRAGLQRRVSGRTIARVEVAHPRAVRRHVAGGADFAARLVGRRVGAARRRGKYLWLPVGAGDADPGEAVLAHLGMSGQLLVQEPDAPDEAHLRVRFAFTDAGRELRFVDQRTFGGLAVEPLRAASNPDGDPDGDPDGERIPGVIAHIARDPLDPAFDDAQFRRALARRRTGVKRALLDQTLVSGVGNIYADEALWRAQLHGARPTETLNRPETERLLAGAREVMTSALAEGGTSFDALYVNINGQSGYFERSLAVYGRAGLPCRRCGAPIRRDAFMNRSSFTCPRCQPRPRRARW